MKLVGLLLLAQKRNRDELMSIRLGTDEVAVHVPRPPAASARKRHALRSAGERGGALGASVKHGDGRACRARSLRDRDGGRELARLAGARRHVGDLDERDDGGSNDGRRLRGGPAVRAPVLVARVALARVRGCTVRARDQKGKEGEGNIMSFNGIGSTVRCLVALVLFGPCVCVCVCVCV